MTYATVERLDDGYIAITTDSNGVEIYETRDQAISAWIEYSEKKEYIAELEAKPYSELTKSEQERLAWGAEANEVISKVNEI